MLEISVSSRSKKVSRDSYNANLRKIKIYSKNSYKNIQKKFTFSKCFTNVGAARLANILVLMTCKLLLSITGKPFIQLKIVDENKINTNVVNILCEILQGILQIWLLMLDITYKILTN